MKKIKNLTIKGNLFILSAPSGAGKSTLCAMALKEFKNLAYSVSCTTRPPRPGEKNKRDYFFLTEKEFKKGIRQKRFLEWAIVHNNYYGTPKGPIHDNINQGKDIILDIDVQGGLNVKKMMPGAVLIFILAPSLKSLENRLRTRRQDSTSVISLRLKNAENEIKCLSKYDYLIINDDLGDAYFGLKNIIYAERKSVTRYNVGEVIKTVLDKRK